AEPGKGRNVLDELLTTMYGGQSFSQALTQLPDAFPALLVAMVASSEGSGQLPMALQRFQHYELRVEQVRKQIIGALIYPAVVMSVGMAIMLFMLFFVIPRFSTVFETVQKLPAAAEIMLWWARLVQQHSLLLWGAIAATFGITIMLVRTARVQKTVMSWLWKLPKLNGYYNLFILARFYRTAGLLMVGGTPVLDALRLAGMLLPPQYQGRLSIALQQLRSGLTMSVVMADNRLTTPIAERLLRVGERSGNLGEMCEKIALFHDGAIDRGVTMFSKIFEPILMLGVGAMVGAIVLLLYMPIFELTGSIS
ncbi:MAG: type II secretion system F family protein, partial [Glaciimonas sp.]|nr:type II secretion system F family protein [Glaciimonas sp.]